PEVNITLDGKEIKIAYDKDNRLKDNVENLGVIYSYYQLEGEKLLAKVEDVEKLEILELKQQLLVTDRYLEMLKEDWDSNVDEVREFNIIRRNLRVKIKEEEIEELERKRTELLSDDTISDEKKEVANTKIDERQARLREQMEEIKSGDDSDKRLQAQTERAKVYKENNLSRAQELLNEIFEYLRAKEKEIEETIAVTTEAQNRPETQDEPEAVPTPRHSVEGRDSDRGGASRASEQTTESQAGTEAQNNVDENVDEALQEAAQRAAETQRELEQLRAGLALEKESQASRDKLIAEFDAKAKSTTNQTVKRNFNRVLSNIKSDYIEAMERIISLNENIALLETEAKASELQVAAVPAPEVSAEEERGEEEAVEASEEAVEEPVISESTLVKGEVPAYVYAVLNDITREIQFFEALKSRIGRIEDVPSDRAYHNTTILDLLIDGNVTPEEVAEFIVLLEEFNEVLKERAAIDGAISANHQMQEIMEREVQAARRIAQAFDSLQGLMVADGAVAALVEIEASRLTDRLHEVQAELEEQRAALETELDSQERRSQIIADLKSRIEVATDSELKSDLETLLADVMAKYNEAEKRIEEIRQRIADLETELTLDISDVKGSTRADHLPRPLDSVSDALVEEAAIEVADETETLIPFLTSELVEELAWIEHTRQEGNKGKFRIYDLNRYVIVLLLEDPSNPGVLNQAVVVPEDSTLQEVLAANPSARAYYHYKHNALYEAQADEVDVAMAKLDITYAFSGTGIVKDASYRIRGYGLDPLNTQHGDRLEVESALLFGRDKARPLADHRMKEAVEETTEVTEPTTLILNSKLVGELAYIEDQRQRENIGKYRVYELNRYVIVLLLEDPSNPGVLSQAVVVSDESTLQEALVTNPNTRAYYHFKHNAVYEAQADEVDMAMAKLGITHAFSGTGIVKGASYRIRGYELDPSITKVGDPLKVRSARLEIESKEQKASEGVDVEVVPSVIESSWLQFEMPSTIPLMPILDPASSSRELTPEEVEALREYLDSDDTQGGHIDLEKSTHKALALALEYARANNLPHTSALESLERNLPKTEGEYLSHYIYTVDLNAWIPESQKADLTIFSTYIPVEDTPVLVIDTEFLKTATIQTLAAKILHEVGAAREELGLSHDDNVRIEEQFLAGKNILSETSRKAEFDARRQARREEVRRQREGRPQQTRTVGEESDQVSEWLYRVFSSDYATLYVKVADDFQEELHQNYSERAILAVDKTTSIIDTVILISRLEEMAGRTLSIDEALQYIDRLNARQRSELGLTSRHLIVGHYRYQPNYDNKLEEADVKIADSRIKVVFIGTGDAVVKYKPLETLIGQEEGVDFPSGGSTYRLIVGTLIDPEVVAARKTEEQYLIGEWQNRTGNIGKYLLEVEYKTLAEITNASREKSVAEIILELRGRQARTIATEKSTKAKTGERPEESTEAPARKRPEARVKTGVEEESREPVELPEEAEPVIEKPRPTRDLSAELGEERSEEAGEELGEEQIDTVNAIEIIEDEIEELKANYLENLEYILELMPRLLTLKIVLLEESLRDLGPEASGQDTKVLLEQIEKLALYRDRELYKLDVIFERARMRLAEESKVEMAKLEAIRLWLFEKIKSENMTDEKLRDIRQYLLAIVGEEVEIGNLLKVYIANMPDEKQQKARSDTKALLGRAIDNSIARQNALDALNYSIQRMLLKGEIDRLEHESFEFSPEEFDFDALLNSILYEALVSSISDRGLTPIHSRLSDQTRELLAEYQINTLPSEVLKDAVVRDLNSILSDRTFYEENGGNRSMLEGISEEEKSAIVTRFNRAYLDRSYGEEILRSQVELEIEIAQLRLQRLDLLSDAVNRNLIEDEKKQRGELDTRIKEQLQELRRVTEMAGARKVIADQIDQIVESILGVKFEEVREEIIELLHRQHEAGTLDETGEEILSQFVDAKLTDWVAQKRGKIEQAGDSTSYAEPIRTLDRGILELVQDQIDLSITLAEKLALQERLDSMFNGQAKQHRLTGISDLHELRRIYQLYVQGDIDRARRVSLDFLGQERLQDESSWHVVAPYMVSTDLKAGRDLEDIRRALATSTVEMLVAAWKQEAEIDGLRENIASETNAIIKSVLEEIVLENQELAEITRRLTIFYQGIPTRADGTVEYTQEEQAQLDILSQEEIKVRQQLRYLEDRLSAIREREELINQRQEIRNKPVADVAPEDVVAIGALDIKIRLSELEMQLLDEERMPPLEETSIQDALKQLIGSNGEARSFSPQEFRRVLDDFINNKITSLVISQNYRDDFRRTMELYNNRDALRSQFSSMNNEEALRSITDEMLTTNGQSTLTDEDQMHAARQILEAVLENLEIEIEIPEEAFRNINTLGEWLRANIFRGSLGESDIYGLVMTILSLVYDVKKQRLQAGVVMGPMADVPLSVEDDISHNLRGLGLDQGSGEGMLSNLEFRLGYGQENVRGGIMFGGVVTEFVDGIVGLFDGDEEVQISYEDLDSLRGDWREILHQILHKREYARIFVLAAIENLRASEQVGYFDYVDAYNTYVEAQNIYRKYFGHYVDQDTNMTREEIEELVARDFELVRKAIVEQVSLEITKHYKFGDSDPRRSTLAKIFSRIFFNISLNYNQGIQQDNLAISFVLGATVIDRQSNIKDLMTHLTVLAREKAIEEEIVRLTDYVKHFESEYANTTDTFRRYEALYFKMIYQQELETLQEFSDENMPRELEKAAKSVKSSGKRTQQKAAVQPSDEEIEDIDIDAVAQDVVLEIEDMLYSFSFDSEIEDESRPVAIPVTSNMSFDEIISITCQNNRYLSDIEFDAFVAEYLRDAIFDNNVITSDFENYLSDTRRVAHFLAGSVLESAGISLGDINNWLQVRYQHLLAREESDAAYVVNGLFQEWDVLDPDAKIEGLDRIIALIDMLHNRRAITDIEEERFQKEGRLESLRFQKLEERSKNINTEILRTKRESRALESRQAVRALDRTRVEMEESLEQLFDASEKVSRELATVQEALIDVLSQQIVELEAQDPARNHTRDVRIEQLRAKIEDVEGVETSEVRFEREIEEAQQTYDEEWSKWYGPAGKAQETMEQIADVRTASVLRQKLSMSLKTALMDLWLKSSLLDTVKDHNGYQAAPLWIQDKLEELAQVVREAENKRGELRREAHRLLDQGQLASLSHEAQGLALVYVPITTAERLVKKSGLDTNYWQKYVNQNARDINSIRYVALPVDRDDISDEKDDVRILMVYESEILEQYIDRDDLGDAIQNTIEQPIGIRALSDVEAIEVYVPRNKMAKLLGREGRDSLSRYEAMSGNTKIVDGVTYIRLLLDKDSILEDGKEGWWLFRWAHSSSNNANLYVRRGNDMVRTRDEIDDDQIIDLIEDVLGEQPVEVYVSLAQAWKVLGQDERQALNRYMEEAGNVSGDANHLRLVVSREDILSNKKKSGRLDIWELDAASGSFVRTRSDIDDSTLEAIMEAYSIEEVEVSGSVSDELVEEAEAQAAIVPEPEERAEQQEEQGEAQPEPIHTEPAIVPTTQKDSEEEKSEGDSSDDSAKAKSKPAQAQDPRAEIYISIKEARELLGKKHKEALSRYLALDGNTSVDGKYLRLRVNRKHVLRNGKEKGMFSSRSDNADIWIEGNGGLLARTRDEIDDSQIARIIEKTLEAHRKGFITRATRAHYLGELGQTLDEQGVYLEREEQQEIEGFIDYFATVVYGRGRGVRLEALENLEALVPGIIQRDYLDANQDAYQSQQIKALESLLLRVLPVYDKKVKVSIVNFIFGVIDYYESEESKDNKGLYRDFLRSYLQAIMLYAGDIFSLADDKNEFSKDERKLIRKINQWLKANNIKRPKHSLMQIQEALTDAAVKEGNESYAYSVLLDLHNVYFLEFKRAMLESEFRHLDFLQREDSGDTHWAVSTNLIVSGIMFLSNIFSNALPETHNDREIHTAVAQINRAIEDLVRIEAELATPSYSRPGIRLMHDEIYVTSQGIEIRSVTQDGKVLRTYTPEEYLQQSEVYRDQDSAMGATDSRVNALTDSVFENRDISLSGQHDYNIDLGEWNDGQVDLDIIYSWYLKAQALDYSQEFEQLEPEEHRFILDLGRSGDTKQNIQITYVRQKGGRNSILLSFSNKNNNLTTTTLVELDSEGQVNYGAGMRNVYNEGNTHGNIGIYAGNDILSFFWDQREKAWEVRFRSDYNTEENEIRFNFEGLKHSSLGDLTAGTGLTYESESFIPYLVMRGRGPLGAHYMDAKVGYDTEKDKPVYQLRVQNTTGRTNPYFSLNSFGDSTRADLGLRFNDPADSTYFNINANYGSGDQGGLSMGVGNGVLDLQGRVSGDLSEGEYGYGVDLSFHPFRLGADNYRAPRVSSGRTAEIEALGDILFEDENQLVSDIQHAWASREISFGKRFAALFGEVSPALRYRLYQFGIDSDEEIKDFIARRESFDERNEKRPANRKVFSDFMELMFYLNRAQQLTTANNQGILDYLHVTNVPAELDVNEVSLDLWETIHFAALIKYQGQQEAQDTLARYIRIREEVGMLLGTRFNPADPRHVKTLRFFESLDFDIGATELFLRTVSERDLLSVLMRLGELEDLTAEFDITTQEGVESLFYWIEEINTNSFVSRDSDIQVLNNTALLMERGESDRNAAIQEAEDIHRRLLGKGLQSYSDARLSTILDVDEVVGDFDLAYQVASLINGEVDKDKLRDALADVGSYSSRPYYHFLIFNQYASLHSTGDFKNMVALISAVEDIA
ncbi:hypothetical protein ACFL96_12505, partial [Thermoproteota archaeon]